MPGEIRDSQVIPATTGSRPATMSGLAPNRASSRGDRRDTANSAAVIGRNENPACSGLKPRMSWTNWVRKKNIPNMPATSSSRAR